MISVELARRLRGAGLTWQPAERDFFALLDRNLDGQVFVVSQLTALLQLYNGQPVITFHGTSEWALDYVLVADAVWLPSETQLRALLEARIEHDTPMLLARTTAGYELELKIGGVRFTFDAPRAEDAYGLALLHLLQHGRG